MTRLTDISKTTLTTLLVPLALSGCLGGEAGTSESVLASSDTPPPAAAPTGVQPPSAGGPVGTAGAPAPTPQLVPPSTSDDDITPPAVMAADERDLGLPPPAPGFKRFYPSAQPVEPGQSKDFIQWIEGPLEQDTDILAVSGIQGVAGHHAVVYSFAEAREIGFTREFLIEDQIATSLLGSASTDGSVGIPLPPNVTFRAKAGSYIVVQSHYINTTEESVMGRSVVDIQMEPADPSRQAAALFANTGQVNIPPGQKTVIEKFCTVPEDVTIFRSNNHMHDHGVSITTEIVDFFGTPLRMIKDDPAWNYEWSLNPNYDVFTLEDPLMIRAGETVRTRCTFENDTASAIGFPNEMCVFTGFIVRDAGDLVCFDGLVLAGGLFDLFAM